MAGTLRKDGCTFKIPSGWIILRKKIFRKILQRISKYKFYFQCLSFPPPPKIVPLWDNVEKYGRVRQATDDNIIWRIACWTTEATDTLRICNTYCFSMVSTVTRMRLTVTLYVRLYYLSCISRNQEQLLGSKPGPPCMLSYTETASGVSYIN